MNLFSRKKLFTCFLAKKKTVSSKHVKHKVENKEEEKMSSHFRKCCIFMLTKTFRNNSPILCRNLLRAPKLCNGYGLHICDGYQNKPRWLPDYQDGSHTKPRWLPYQTKMAAIPNNDCRPDQDGRQTRPRWLP